MNPKPKRFLSVLILMMILGVLPQGSFAQDGALPLPTSEGRASAPPSATAEPDGALPAEQTFLNDDFETGLDQWAASPDVKIVVDDSGNSAVELLPGISLSPLQNTAWTSFEATVWFNLDSAEATGEGNDTGSSNGRLAIGQLKLNFGSNYVLTLTTAGASLADGNQPDVSLAGSAVAHPQQTWQRLDLTVSGGSVIARVNDAEEINYTAGNTTKRLDIGSTIVPFSITTAAAGRVLIDDVLITNLGRDLSELPATIPTIDAGIPLQFDATKLSGELLQLVEAEKFGRSAELRDAYALAPDGKTRISVDLWAAEGVTGEALVALVEAADGKVETVDYKRVSARLSVLAVAALSLSDQISVIHLTPRLSASNTLDAEDFSRLNVANSRNPQGPVVSEGYDTMGAQSWHAAEYLGSGVRVAVIDVGFGDPSVAYSGEMSCLPTDAITLEFGARAAGDSNRGLNGLEVLCDIARGSEVRLYKAQNTDQLHDAVQEAIADQNRVIVIGVDLGANVSPGDGTLGYTSTKNPYAVLQTARDGGAVIVSAAGNSRTSYTTFELIGGANITMTVTARPGTPVNLGWNDWDANPNGGAGREDFAASLAGGGFGTLNKPARGTANPGYQFIIPASCTQSGGFCTTTLTINGLVGDPSIVQVQAGGLDSTITAVAGVTPFQRSGSLARPADSDDVIAVGAICASIQNNYPNLPYSSLGPVYLAGGDYIEITEGPYTGNQVKPELVAPSQVSTSLNAATTLNNCTEGFGGSQAGAAHVGAQVALLLSNPDIASFQQPANLADRFSNILKYLRTHSFDLPFGFDANGYDMRRGAGVPVLGAPTFNPDALPDPGTFFVPNRIPAGECAGGFLYAGPYNVGAANMDGTITRPYNHISQAIKIASELPNRCVIALPGEYSSPLYINDPTEVANDVSVFAYASVVRTVVPASTYYTVNVYSQVGPTGNKRGAVYVEEEGFKFSGFEIIPGVISETGIHPEPAVLVTDTAAGVQFSNNTIRNFVTRDIPLIQILDGSQNVAIRGNRFVDNVNATDADDPLVLRGFMTLITVEDSGATTGRIVIDQNTFRRNRSINGLWLLKNMPDLPPDPVEPITREMNWMPLIRLVDSYTDVSSNTFRDNEAEVLITAATRLTVAPFETRILGNAIVNNRIYTGDGFSSGPLIHLFNMQKIYVVNNTIARNDLIDSGGDGLLIGRGDEILGNFNTGTPNNNNSGSLATEQSAWEFHGNFMVDNLVDRDNDEDGIIDETLVAASQVIGDLEASGIGCRNIAGAEDEGAHNNWFYRAAFSLGACAQAVIGDGNDNGNIFNLDPLPRDPQYVPTGGVTYILGGPATNRFSPAYYSLAGSSNDSEPDGVDEGFDSFVTTILPEFAAGKDARGVSRRNDGNASGTIEIDIGAYEVTPLELISPIALTVNEDSGVVNVELNSDYLTGGFPPYEITIPQTGYPKYYGIAGVDGSTCDTRFTAQARGVAVAFLTDGTPVLSYCPPPDFHTNTTDPDFVLSDVGFDFILSDLSSATASSTVQMTINPTDDAILATTLGDNIPAGDILDAPVGIGRPIALNTVRLRPFVDFSGNFLFSERGNTIEPSAQEQVDYTFTYTTPVLLNDASNVNPDYLSANLQVVNAAQGKIGFELAAAAAPPGGFAQAKFSYNVTDARAGTVTNIITVRAVLPPGDFALLTPADATNFAQTSDVRIFTWEEPTNTQNYLFTAERTSVPVPEVVLNLSGLTAAQDTDQLVCASGICTLTLTDADQALFISGEYRWSVTANNEGVTTVASNAPFNFAVSLGINLIKNGSFEQPGATPQEAAEWANKGIDNDKRVCNKVNRPGKPDKIVAYELNCAFQFKGSVGISSKIQQKLTGFGRAGDAVELSYFAQGKNLTAGAGVNIKLTYANGQNEKLTIDPDTGTYLYQSFSTGQDTLLDDTVTKAKVKIQFKNGTGKLLIDAVKFILETDSTFNLLTPVSNDVFTDAGDLTTLSWQLSVGATTYDLDVNLGVGTVFSADGLTPDADSDALTCANQVCRYTLNGAQQDLLLNGTYTWQVVSNGGFVTPATNGPLTFVVDSEQANLLSNSTFEATKGNGLPEVWKDSNLVASKPACNQASTGKYPAYQGFCAMEFKGAPAYNGKLSQNADITNIAVGNNLILNAVISGTGVPVDSGAKIKMKVVYTDGTSEPLEITIPAQSYAYTRFTQTLQVSKTVQKVKLSISYKGASGSFLIDNVQVLLDTTP